MNIIMLNQTLTRYYTAPCATEYEQQMGDGSNNRWHTTYLTDIPIDTPYAQAQDMILDLLNTHPDFEPLKIYNKCFSMERDGVSGFWHFTLETTIEIMVFAINEDEDNAAETAGTAL